MLEEKYNKGWCSAGSVGFFWSLSENLCVGHNQRQRWK